MGLKQGYLERDLLHQYRRDRADLLTFVLTAGLLEKVVMPPGTVSLEEVDLDRVSVGHVLDCARKGSVLEIWEAMRRFQDDMPLPSKASPGLGEGVADDCSISGRLSNHVQSFEGLSTDSTSASEELSIVTLSTEHLHMNDEATEHLHMNDEAKGDSNGSGQEYIQKISAVRHLHEGIDLALDLPPFITGLSDDDLRETAYEVLLASVGGAGGLISPAKEKPSNVTRFTKNAKNTGNSHSVRAPGLAGLLETMRIQMKISEATDTRTREALLRAAAGRVGKRMDTLLVPLELLFVVGSEDFPDIKSFFQWEKRQLNLLEEGLVHHPYARYDMTDRLGADLRLLLTRIEHCQALPYSMAQIQRAESLKILRGVATALAEGVGSGEQSGEFCHWADGYHLNVRLYEMLLGSVFDRMNPDQIVEEVEEILELLKSTWRVLGITQTVHDTCYTWVLFRQFVLTGEAALLQHSTQQMKRIASDGQRGTQERNYMKTLRSNSKNESGSQALTYVQAVLIPIKLWADKRLEDYHAHFIQDLAKMDALVTIAMIASKLIADEIEQAGNNKLSSTAEIVAVAKQAKDYISSSIAHAFERALEVVESKWESQSEHPLALLAEELLAVAKLDTSLFVSILARWHPQAQAISASMLHKLYYGELKPFVEGISSLTDDVTSVLPAADRLETVLRQLVFTVIDEGSNSYKQDMVPYQVEVVASNLILQWIHSQLANVNDCIEEAVNNETWESVSTDQCYGISVLKVFEMIEGVVDGFSNLKLPMRIPILRSLMNGLDGALQLYANRVVAQLGDVADLIPPLPGLTRYKKDTVVKAFSKKKAVDSKILDEKRIAEINLLSTSRLCICLNTLHQLGCKADEVEENIKERWSTIRPSDDHTMTLHLSRGNLISDGDLRLRHLSRSSEEFSMGFESFRRIMKLSIDKFCEFTGTKIVFWDMKDSFIDGLYKISVSQSRIGKVVIGLESVLVQLCEMIVEPLRDQVVMSLFQACLDGLMRVLLDGGASRSFSQSDGDTLTEDLNVLKSCFMADGDGLPKSLVDSAAASVEQVIGLYKVETWIVIENFKHANDGNLSSGASQTASIRKVPSDTEMLLRVLCHRPDREAAKFLKKHYKFP